MYEPNPAGVGTAGFSIQRLANYLICLCIAFAVLYLGASFFIPIVYGIFFAFLLKPLANRYERYLENRVLAIFLAMLMVFLTLGGVVAFFVIQIGDVLTEADDIVSAIRESSYEVLTWLGESFGMRQREVFALLNEQIEGLSAAPIGLLTSGLTTSGAMLANFLLIVIYVFFFLLYSTALKNFFLGQLRGPTRQEGDVTIHEVQEVATNYLGGMLTVMFILGVLNSLGLWLIGIRFPLVWGFMGALLAIIPYVGTFFGGLLPFLYAVATVDSWWQPVAVVILYVTVQSIEGNLITPKVVGNSVKINALAAVLSLIFGALFWGIAGVVLAIPLLAMVRVILDHIDSTKTLALLLSDELYNHSDKFLNEYNCDKHRIRSLFKKNPVVSVDRVRDLTRQQSDKIGQTDAEVIPNSEPQ